MLEYIFTFESSHSAIAAHRSIVKSFENARLIPLPPKIDAGCGLVLRVFEEDFKACKNILEAVDKKYSEIFLKENSDYKKVG